MTDVQPTEKRVNGIYPVDPEGHLSSASLFTAKNDRNLSRVRLNLITPLDGKKSKVFIEVPTTRGVALADLITGSLYCPESGRCWSSPHLRLEH